MKKLLLLFICILGTATSFAANKLICKEGNVQVLHEQADAKFVLDLSKTTFEKDDNFKEWCGDSYSERVSLMTDTLIACFNRTYELKLNKAKVENSKYTFIFHVDNFVRKPGSFHRAFIRSYGTIDIIDNSTGNKVCSITVDGVEGDSDYVETERFTKAMEGLVKRLHKIFK